MTKEEKEEWAAIGQELQTLADGHPRFHVQYRMSSSQGNPLCCEILITKKGLSAGGNCEEAGV